jgi:hypothetical protein
MVHIERRDKQSLPTHRKRDPEPPRKPKVALKRETPIPADQNWQKSIQNQPERESVDHGLVAVVFVVDVKLQIDPLEA